MAIRWDQWSQEQLAIGSAPTETPEESWLALRLCCLPWPLHGELSIPAELRIFRSLAAGNAGGAIRLAIRRLKSVGIRPPVYGGVADQAGSRLWAAAMVFPISHGFAMRAAAILDPSMKGARHG
jgi:CRISPR-associated protein Csx17